MTGRYILNWQLRTPSVSRSQAGAFYINTAEKWISRIMMWSWGMTSAKGSVFLFENVSLKRYYLQVDCASISEIAPAGKPILLRYWRNSNTLGSQQLLPMFTGIMHQKKEAEHVVVEGFERHGFLLAVVTGKRGQWNNHIILRLHRSTSAAQIHWWWLICALDDTQMSKGLSQPATTEDETVTPCVHMDEKQLMKECKNSLINTAGSTFSPPPPLSPYQMRVGVHEIASRIVGTAIITK